MTTAVRRRHLASHRHSMLLHWRRPKPHAAHGRLCFVVWFSARSSVSAVLAPAGPQPGGDWLAIVEPSSSPSASGGKICARRHHGRCLIPFLTPPSIPFLALSLARSSRLATLCLPAVHAWFGLGARPRCPSVAHTSAACSRRTTTGCPSLLAPPCRVSQVTLVGLGLRSYVRVWYL